jgi:uncharacterized membrane protein SpoIIM required for sporulation
MREALFIKKNKEKWERYQQQQTENPDELADRFVTLMDDLAYARTFYPKSNATIWINGITANIYQSIYINKKEKGNRFVEFFKYELPLVFAKYQGVFLFTTIIFLLLVALGFYCSAKQPELITNVLGHGYVAQTEENINSGDPFGIYKDDSKFAMFIYIAFNNIRVSFIMFIEGFTLGFLTLKHMWETAMMLGVFQQMFFAKGLGAQAVLVIFIHGTLEIAAIVVACVSGFVIARGMIIPGTVSRFESFKQHGKDAAKILISTIPILIVAAFFESYVTYLMSSTFDAERNVSLPIWVGVLILIVSLAFVVYYYGILPYKLKKRGYTLAKHTMLDNFKLNDA